MKYKFKKGDNVVVQTGKDKNKSGQISSIETKSGKAIVAGINIYKKSTKPSKKYPQGGIMEISKPIDLSNLLVICPNCKKTSRIKIKNSSDANTRVCNKCSEALDVK